MYVVDFAKNLFKMKNISIIIYLVINILLYVSLLGGFTNGGMAGGALLLYAITLCIALSPVGEFFLRLQTGCRKIKRKDYLDRLMPLFEEVYAQAKAKDPTISDSVKLYMSDNLSPNAFATGRKTICVTKGFLGFTDAQIKGTLAHEFAHLAHKDTDFVLLITVGNMLMTVIFVIYRIIVNFFVLLFASALRMGFLGSFLTSFFINIILTFFMWLWTKLGLLLVMHASREQEFAADRFAAELGYGNDLCVVLDSFSVADGESKSFWVQLHSTHPSVDDRIARLQEMGADYANPYGHNIHAVNAAPENYGYSHETAPVLPPSGTGYQIPPQGSVPRQSIPAGAAALTNATYTPRPLQQPSLPQPAEQPINPEFIICWQCDSTIIQGKKFCAKCGATAEKPKELIIEEQITVFCIACGVQVDVDDSFCGECGAPVVLPEEQPVPVCKDCGSEVDIEDTFCGECGAPVAQPPEEQPPPVCGTCGNEIDEGDPFCGECGEAL